MYLVKRKKESATPIEMCHYEPSKNRGKYKSIRFKKRFKSQQETHKAIVTAKIIGQLIRGYFIAG